MNTSSFLIEMFSYFYLLPLQDVFFIVVRPSTASIHGLIKLTCVAETPLKIAKKEPKVHHHAKL
jgi:hypothetical protein